MERDAIVIGAGAAGLFCAFQAAQRGCSVLVLEKQARPGLKILISGGGRCNFTNLEVEPLRFTSQNPHFCKSALARYTSADFIALVEQHGIPYHEKHRGQLFCDRSSKEILNMLLRECEKVGVRILYGVHVESVEKNNDTFCVATTKEKFITNNLVVATGGLSYKNLGATDFGYNIAKSFGHEVVTPLPALTPLLWSKADRERWSALAGLACPVSIKSGKVCEADDLLFTHNGLSGPVILRVTLRWVEGEPLFIDFFPHQDLASLLKEKKREGNKSLLKNVLCHWIPARLAEFLCHELQMAQSLGEISISRLESFANTLRRFPVNPASVDGFDKAEVTVGGVATNALSSQTMESKLCPGLYFIGEVVDVTGDLGGYNFHWAWASGFVAAEAIRSSFSSVDS